MHLEELTGVSDPEDDGEGYRFEITGDICRVQLKTKTLEEATGWVETIQHNLRLFSSMGK
jgi:hypothetical protein